MTKIVVTGATGYIGKHLLKSLSLAKCDIVLIGRNRPMCDTLSGFQFEQVDLFNQKATDKVIKAIKPDILIHLAWEATPGLFWTSEKNFDWIAASAHLLSSFVENGGKRAILAGTCAEYQWGRSILEEDKSLLAPNTNYSVSKNCFQQISNLIGSEIELLWCRLFFPYGPDEHSSKLVSYIVSSLEKGEVPHINVGNRAVDLIHVEDAGQILSDLTFSSAVGTINICSGKAWLPFEITREAALLLNKTHLLPEIEKKVHNQELEISVQGSTVRLFEFISPNQLRSLSDGLLSYVSQ